MQILRSWNERLFFSFHHVMYSLRGGFLIRPLIIALALGSAGALLRHWKKPSPRSAPGYRQSCFPLAPILKWGR